jgi:hypothetical protein
MIVLFIVLISMLGEEGNRVSGSQGYRVLGSQAQGFRFSGL